MMLLECYAETFEWDVFGGILLLFAVFGLICAALGSENVKPNEIVNLIKTTEIFTLSFGVIFILVGWSQEALELHWIRKTYGT